MKHAKPLSIIVLALLAVLWAAPAFAGGWAVATLDHLPEQVIAGEPVQIGYMVRQHGVTPAVGLVSVIRMQKEGSPNIQWAKVIEEGEPGHYSATLVFPTAGTWQWSIETGYFPERQPMPALVVVAADSARGGPAPAAGASDSPLPWALGAAGAIGFVGSTVALARTKSPWAGAAALIALLIGGYGLALAAPQTAASESQAAVAPDLSAERGQRLFVAKGCVVCHTHAEVPEAKQFTMLNTSPGFAPNLTDFTADPDYLARWLDNPKSIKPETYMPRLNLSADEIGALTAFINAP